MLVGTSLDMTQRNEHHISLIFKMFRINNIWNGLKFNVYMKCYDRSKQAAGMAYCPTLPQKGSHTGNRTRAAWVKTRNPNH